MTATEIPVDNGVNVEALLGVRDALPGTPEIAQFQWRSTVWNADRWRTPGARSGGTRYGCSPRTG